MTSELRLADQPGRVTLAAGRQLPDLRLDPDGTQSHCTLACGDGGAGRCDVAAP